MKFIYLYEKWNFIYLYKMKREDFISTKSLEETISNERKKCGRGNYKLAEDMLDEVWKEKTL